MPSSQGRDGWIRSRARPRPRRCCGSLAAWQLVVPTPGHTAGHQSLVVRADDGSVLVAGQGHDTARYY